jgi:hypothetical protein
MQTANLIVIAGLFKKIIIGISITPYKALLKKPKSMK